MKNFNHKIFSIFVISFLMFGSIMAQPPSREDRKERMEKIKQLKRDFIKKNLELTAHESSGFWVVYDSFEQRREALRKEHRTLRQKFKDKRPENFTEEDAQEILDNEMRIKEKRLSLDKEYELALREVLSASKVLKLYKLERQFKRKLLQKMGERRGARGGHPHPPHGDEDVPFED